MAQTREGAIKTAANHIGITTYQYLANIQAELKRCRKCKKWLPISLFGKDISRGDGLKTVCSSKGCGRVVQRKNTKGYPSPFKGKKHTEEARIKIGLSKKGKSSPKKGIPRTDKEKESIRKGVLKTQTYGKDNPNYIDGRADTNMLRRKDSRYKAWRKSVFERDNYTCQHCGDNKGGNLNAHHIKLWREFPEHRFDINNGITLCILCHQKEHYG